VDDLVLAEVLEAVLRGDSLDEDRAEATMRSILAGEQSAAGIAGLLVALRAKGEAVEEIVGFARAMRAAALRVPCESDALVDTCGTGGDGSGTFNISTSAAFVVAGAGGHVAKHGNRSVSSRCGSADVLEALGAELSLTPEQVGKCVDDVGFGFLFAPALHGAMRHAVEPRKALGVRTVFNILGPLTNPAGAQHQLLGVFAPQVQTKLAAVLRRLGTARTLVVHGDDGLDEISLAAPSTLIVVEGDDIETLRVRAEDVGLKSQPAAELTGGDAEVNARILREVLSGVPGAPRDVVLLNAGAALWSAKVASDLREGVGLATASVDDGRAAQALDAYIELTRRLAA